MEWAALEFFALRIEVNKVPPGLPPESLRVREAWHLM
jgi:hypothetical protein